MVFPGSERYCRRYSTIRSIRWHVALLGQRGNILEARKLLLVCSEPCKDFLHVDLTGRIAISGRRRLRR